MKRHKTNSIVRDQVAEALLENRDYTAPELKRIVEKELKKKGFNYHFTPRKYLDIKKELLPNLKPRPIDQPWTVGACIEYNIPPDIIPVLIKYRQMIYNSRTPDGKKDLARFRLSIRKARWIAKIYPVIIERLKQLFPTDPKKQIGYLSRIADEYSRREKVAEIRGISLNTYVLDTLLFVENGISIDDAILSALPESWTEQEYKNFQLSMEELAVALEKMGIQKESEA